MVERQERQDNMLLRAAHEGDVLQVKKALESGAYVNARSFHTGQTALHFAVEHSFQVGGQGGGLGSGIRVGD